MIEKFIRDALILWTTIDPISTLAIFVAVTRNMTDAERKRAAVKAIGYAAIILVSAIVLGQLLLTSMGIRLISLQVAGGVILFLFGLQMIFGTGAASDQPSKEAGHDVAVFPLAVPSTATPGAILAVILLTDNQAYSIPVQAGTTLIMLAVLGMTLALMLGARHVLRIIGTNGASILVRVMGMVLAALSIELVMEALHIPQWVNQAAATAVSS